MKQLGIFFSGILIGAILTLFYVRNNGSETQGEVEQPDSASVDARLSFDSIIPISSANAQKTTEEILSEEHYSELISSAGFERFEYNVPNDPRRIPYRLCELHRSSDPASLVIFLHGGNGYGRDNDQQVQYTIHSPKQLYRYLAHRREHAFILVPQLPQGQLWGNNINPVMAIVQNLVATKKVDPKRIYITGTSNGARGVYAFLQRHPGVFAAALVAACGDQPNINLIRQTPVYGVTGRSEGNRTAYFNSLAAAGGDCKYEHHPNWNHGQVCGWSHSAYMDTVMTDYSCACDPRLEWLFGHVR